MNVVFDAEDHTSMGHKFQNKTFKIAKLSFEQEEYVSINAMKKGSTRSGSNVTKLRTFLFEMDEDINGNTISQRDQGDLIIRSGMPWSTCTFSGSKSLHFLITLQEPLKDRPIYTAYFLAIQEVLKKYGAKIDSACKDPGRFTRAPFGVNTKPELKEKKPSEDDRRQVVKKVRRRIDILELDQWLSDNGVNVNDYITIPVNRPILEGATSNATVEHKFNTVANNFMSNMRYEDGNYNYQYKMAWYLLGCGCTVEEIRNYFMTKWNHIHENDPIGGANKSEVKCGPIYISDPLEQAAYYKKEDSSVAMEIKRSGYERDVPKDVKRTFRPESIERYMTVGTEYFKIDSTTDKLIPWSKTMFEKLYTSAAIPPLLYDKFGYKPDYTSERFPYDLGTDRRTRNTFIRPSYSITPGDWSTIEGGLQHGFGDQYDLILLYCAISIMYPETKLPAILFLGPENMGKSAVIAIFRELVGLNVFKKVSSKKLESGFTDFLAQSQLILVEEVGGFKDPKSVMDDLKDWITETGTQSVNPKYGKQFDSPIHAKFIFTSNNYDALHLSGAATRFWVREITDKPKTSVSDYYGRIEKEMGHFAHYLINEIGPKIRLDANGKPDTEKSRLYFAPEDFKTDVKDMVKNLSNSDLYEIISDTIANFFQKYPDETTCYADLKSIIDHLPLNFKNIGYKKIKLCLQQEFGVPVSATLLKRPDSLNWIGNEEGLKTTRLSRWFSFDRKNFIDDLFLDMSKVQLA